LFQPKPKLFETLLRREYEHATQVLSKELGMPHDSLMEGEQISGTYTKPVSLASGKYAIIQKAQEFTLCRGDRTWSRCVAKKSQEPHQHKAFSGSGDHAGGLVSDAFPRFLAFPD
jgi:Protein of unknown function (DUF3363)